MLDPGIHVQDDDLIAFNDKVPEECLYHRMGRAGTAGTHGTDGPHHHQVCTGWCRDSMLFNNIVNREGEPEHAGIVSAGLEPDQVPVLGNGKDLPCVLRSKSEGHRQVGGRICINCNDRKSPGRKTCSKCSRKKCLARFRLCLILQFS